MPQVRAQEDWHRADVKAALEKAGWNLSRLSTRSGLHPGTLRKVFVMSYPKAERIIAYVLGVKPADIWPSRYAKRQTPKDIPRCVSAPSAVARSKRRAA